MKVDTENLDIDIAWIKFCGVIFHTLGLFDTDEDRVYLETTILCRDGFKEKNKMSESMSELERERMQLVL